MAAALGSGCPHERRTPLGRNESRSAARKPQRLRIGEGKISGYLSIFLAVLSFGAVLAFHFPQVLTTPEFRAVYSVEVLRWVLLAALVLSFGFALTSFMLSGKTKLGLIGVVISAVAILLGGAGVEVQDFEQSIFTISLDWLLIDIVVLSAIFIPLELFLPKRPEQTKFHLEWKTDLVYFSIAHLIVQFTAVAVKVPAETLFGDWLAGPLAALGLTGLQAAVAGLSFVAQVLLAMLVADLFQYAAHRAFHAVPRSGASTPCTTRCAPWTGWPARACTSSTCS